MSRHLLVLVLSAISFSTTSALNIAQPQTLNLPLPTPSTSLIAPSIQNLTSPTDPRLKCTKRPIVGPETRPRFENCRVAINSLPSILGQGFFHTGPTDDGFLLPVRRSFMNCAVVVNLRDKVTGLEGRWLEVRDAAMVLNEECRKTRRGVELTGGKITAGVQAGLVIRLGHNGEASGNGLKFEVADATNGTGNETVEQWDVEVNKSTSSKGTGVVEGTNNDRDSLSGNG